MRTIQLWQGIRMREVTTSGEQEAAPRLVTIPADWDDAAAEALASLVPGEGRLGIVAASAMWLGVIALRARHVGRGGDLALALHGLLRRRRAAPNAAIWQGLDRQSLGDTAPGFVLNLGGFHDPTSGFDVTGFGEAAADVAAACRLLAPDAARYEIGLAGLDDLLAALGLDYATNAARDVGACLAALFRARIGLALEPPQRDLLARPAGWPVPPASSAIPGLAAAAAAARDQVSVAPGAVLAAGVFPAGPVEALLGVETGGIAPAFTPVRDGRLSRAAQNRLAASGVTPMTALATSLLGDDPLPVAADDAHVAMHDAVAHFLETVPPRPAALPRPDCIGPHEAGPADIRAVATPLPARPAGMARKVSVGGHRVFLRTGEYDDGRLGEITIALPREGHAMRGLMECVAQAVSIGLQHGVRLEAFVDAFVLTQFGPEGTVEGDPAVGRASSVLDYVFRSLSANYLDRALPEPETGYTSATDRHGQSLWPLLPLDLPQGASPRMRRRALRVVG